jgi:hypothetical protein
MKITSNCSLYRVQIDLVGFAGNTFLDGWAMTKANLQKVNRKLGDTPFIGVFSATGSISNEDDNSEGDNKVYIAVEALAYTPSEKQAIAYVLARVVDPLMAALPARGGFEIDGEADCLDSGLATAQDAENLLLCLPKKSHNAVVFMRDTPRAPIVA